MKIRMMAFALSIALLTLVSCDRSDDNYSDFIFTRNIVLSGQNEVPAVNTAATGIASLEYNKRNKTLSYTINFSGLSANASAAHIHGLAGPGFNAGIVQTFGGFPAATSGTYRGTLFADGVQVKEDDILSGRFYINIHTATNPGGEIRGQIVF